MTRSQAGMRRAVRLPIWSRRPMEMDAACAAAGEYDAPRSPLLESLAKASQGRATAMDLLAQAAGIAALAAAVVGMWMLKIWE